MTADHRADLLERLGRYASSRFFLPEETESLRRVEAFVRAHADCFERSNRTGHITASAWLVDPASRCVVLLHHKKLGLWLQPGGHADGNPDVESVARTEAIEETGIRDLELVSPDIFDVDVHPIPARRHEGAHFHYDVRFLFQVRADSPLRRSEESHALRWVQCSEVPLYTDDRSVLRMLEKGRSASV